MPNRRRGLQRMATLLVALQWMAAAWAGSGAAEPFAMSSRTEAVEGRDARQRIFVSSGTHEFCVLLPSGYGAVLGNESSVVLSAPDNLTFISISRREVPTPPGKELGADECRTAVAAEYPGATILEESTFGAGDHQGPSFDLRWFDSTKQARWLRVVYVPTQLGLLQFTLTTTQDRFPATRFDLARVMGTFASGKRGELDVKPLSNLF